jgi:hypothetical protein
MGEMGLMAPLRYKSIISANSLKDDDQHGRKRAGGNGLGAYAAIIEFEICLCDMSTP